MPVAVRLIEVLAIIALVATMAAGAGIVIFIEKCLIFLSKITHPLVSFINFFLGIIKVLFLKILFRLTYLMEHLTQTFWEKSSSVASKCRS